MKQYSLLSLFVIRRSPGFFAVALAAVLTAPTILAKEITLPAEKAELRPSAAPGYPLARTMCATCHSVDYIETQPPGMPDAFWRHTVDKMRETFGATIPDESAQVILRYLIETYGRGPTDDRVPSSNRATRQGTPTGR